MCYLDGFCQHLLPGDIEGELVFTLITFANRFAQMFGSQLLGLTLRHWSQILQD